MKTWILASVCALGLLTACANSPPEESLTVVVGSDFAALHEVYVSLSDSTGREVDSETFSVSKLGLPFSFGIVSPTAEDGKVGGLLRIDALRSDGTSAFSRTARLDGSPYGGRTLYLYLAAQCELFQCGEWETCTEQGCASEFVSFGQTYYTEEGREFDGLCQPQQSWCSSDARTVERCDQFGQPPSAEACGANEACAGNPPSCVSGNHSSQPQLALLIRGSGGGALAMDGLGERCESDCTVQVDDQQSIRVWAEPDSNSYFVGWEMGCSGTNPECWITMNGDQTIAARFERSGDVMHRVEIVPEGTGSGRVYSQDGTLDCPNVRCWSDLAQGTPVTVIADPDANSSFNEWRGLCSGTLGNICSFTVNGPVQLRPTFQAGPTTSARFDLNGDGYGDVIYAAPGLSAHSAARAGRVYVKFGPVQRQHWGAFDSDRQWDGTEAQAELGRALSADSDLTSDGYVDLVVGAPGTLGKTGAVYAIAGGPGLIGSQNLMLHPMVLQGQRSGELFGASLSTRADVDGDGLADLLVGAPGDGSMLGRVYVFLSGGFSSGGGPYPAIIIEGEQLGDRFGWSVQSAGDLDGNGSDEFIVGAPRYDVGTRTDAGRAYVFKFDTQLTQAQDAEIIVSGAMRNALLGFSVTGLGDWQGDSTADWAVSSHVNDQVFIFTGFQTTQMVAPTSARWTLSSQGFFGAALGGFEDYTGDGRPDLVAGAPVFGGVGGGQVRVYAGGGPTSSPAFIIEASCAADAQCTEESLGYTVGPIGDLDLDGVMELGVGSRAGGLNFGPVEAGRIMIFDANDPLRPANARSMDAPWQISGEFESGGLCASLSEGGAYDPRAANPLP